MAADRDNGADGAMTVERLEAFCDAWGRKDVDELMSFMTVDCIYQASVGVEPGKTYRGRDAVEQGYREMLHHDADGESRNGRCVVAGNVGLAEWSYVFSTNGGQVEVRGCDIFEFVGDKIHRKDAFRKVFG